MWITPRHLKMLKSPAVFLKPLPNLFSVFKLKYPKAAINVQFQLKDLTISLIRLLKEYLIPVHRF